MKRRFQVTLLAVAIAVVGSTAFAMAPTIGFVPSPVIADDTPATTANNFFYPDALDADTLATDEDGTVESTGIIWSYYSDSGNYQINGRDSLDPENVANDPNNPTSAQELGAPGATYDSGLDDPDAVDSNLRTWTFRDKGYSPIGGAPYADPNPTNETTEVIRNEVVTLFASDGSSWSMTSVMVYTESNGRDRLSSTGEVILDQTPSGTLGWTSSDLSGGAMTFLDSSGLCIQTPAAGSNFGLWVSPYDIVDLTQSKVYRVRLTMDSNGTPIAAGETPFWDFVIDNNGSAGAQNKYAADFMNWDKEGGANSVGLSTTTGRGTFDIWYAPPAVTAADWNDPSTGEFIAASDADNDMRFTFRVLDVDGVVDGPNDAGTICLRNVNVTTFDIDTLTPVGSPIYNVTDITASTHVIGSVFGATNTTTSFSGGDVTISPVASNPDAWDVEVISFDPGNTDTSTAAELLDNYPVPWEADKLLKGTLTVQAPNAQGESTPPDVISMVWDSPTNELLSRNEVYAATNTLGLPKVAAPTDLVSFFYTHNLTASSATNYDNLRMRVLLLLTDTIDAGGNANNLGGITILAEKIEEIAAP